MPLWLEPTVHRIGQAALALGLMAAGAGMQLGSLTRAKVLGVMVLAIKHLGMPLMAFGLAMAVPAGPDTDHGAADVLGRAHRVQLLRAGRPHGLRRTLRGGSGDLVDPAGMASLPFALGVLA
jgi:malonate transporter and related proteins